ncbi:MAG: nicotinate-nucleotide diphosphorylase (carboxylating) [Candidatus Margulisbacteria bacterium GWF2_38_17]|nr:MAG: nicotinate-nucleotide diphosphorylase (carboxylating) [Candidatus Margulisbacteria bacterium GWD2_39_127]OGI05357.1 MAG: nicotinate-nucleotide diphosphorylase (carboxylating) [Candidatus Margulisbacteria bacterium GWF2_38_17]OGI05814.1 MAG: nicotinate-nucleotide diphosphorylase (carboxylating) [Candidatus Margulisbacteria bacterium GWE2_39_32]
MSKIEVRDYQSLVAMALLEDVKSGDITSQATIPDDSVSRAIIKTKQAGVICGVDIALHVFFEIDPTLIVITAICDGQIVDSGVVIMTVEGKTRSILMAERTVLNFLSRLSGIATETRTYVDMIKGTIACICDTRKTIPGWRKLDKYAVAIGGGTNHRIGLWDAILIKENHINAAGSVSKALEKAKQFAARAAFIQIEITDIQQLEEALPLEPDMVLLDNMSIDTIIKAVEMCKKNNYNILIEASGNVNIENVRGIAMTGVDRISVGAITHSAKNFDFTLLIE